MVVELLSNLALPEGKIMPQFENPFQDKPSGARPIPGVVSLQIASFLEVFGKMWGINLYQHEHEGLAHVIEAVMRAFPKLADTWKQPDPSP